MVVIEGLDDRRASLRGDLVRPLLPIVGGRTRDHNGRALSPDPRDFDGWGVFWHGDGRRNIEPPRGHRDGLGVVAGAVGDHASRPRLLGEPTDGVQRSAGLERADVLQVLGL